MAIDGWRGRTASRCRWASVRSWRRLRPKRKGFADMGPRRVFFSESVLEVLEVDILWPRWVARIGVTRSTQAWFLTADRQCTELPLLRLPRLVHELVL